MNILCLTVEVLDPGIKLALFRFKQKRTSMLRRHKLLLLIPAILLIPILLGMTPLNIAHKLASGGPFTHCKQAHWSNRCLFNSVTSHGNPVVVNLDLIQLDQELMPAFDIQVLDSDFIHSNVAFSSVPLRC